LDSRPLSSLLLSCQLLAILSLALLTLLGLRRVASLLPRFADRLAPGRLLFMGSVLVALRVDWSCDAVPLVELSYRSTYGAGAGSGALEIEASAIKQSQRR
jgi:hypothetical protein